MNILQFLTNIIIVIVIARQCYNTPILWHGHMGHNGHGITCIVFLWTIYMQGYILTGGLLVLVHRYSFACVGW